MISRNCRKNVSQIEILPMSPGPPKPFILDTFVATETFHRDGFPALFDPCRQILVPATPEENVRQQLIAYLKGELGILGHLIRTEVHLSNLLPRVAARGRVDVVVSGPDSRPLVLVECKAQHIALTDDALDQVLRYHKATEAAASVIATTNGVETRWYRVTKYGAPQQLVHAPRVRDLLGGTLPSDLAPEELPPRPKGVRLPSDNPRLDACEWGSR